LLISVRRWNIKGADDIEYVSSMYLNAAMKTNLNVDFFVFQGRGMINLVEREIENGCPEIMKAAKSDFPAPIGAFMKENTEAMMISTKQRVCPSTTPKPVPSHVECFFIGLHETDNFNNFALFGTKLQPMAELILERYRWLHPVENFHSL